MALAETLAGAAAKYAATFVTKKIIEAGKKHDLERAYSIAAGLTIDHFTGPHCPSGSDRWNAIVDLVRSEACADAMSPDGRLGEEELAALRCWYKQDSPPLVQILHKMTQEISRASKGVFSLDTQGSINNDNLNADLILLYLSGLAQLLEQLSRPAVTRPSFIWHPDIPQLPAHDIVGREAQLADLVQRLTSGGNIALSADGQGGVGKTTLAIQVARSPEIQGHFTDGVLWAGLGRAPDLPSLLNGWGEQVGVDVSSEQDNSLKAQAITSRIADRRFLLIVDDAWQMDAATLMRCGGPNCRHLLTTRDKRIATEFAGQAGNVSDVPPLSNKDAYSLLSILAPIACQADPDAARALAKAVGGLPLSIELLGAYLSGSAMRYSEARDEAIKDMGNASNRLVQAKKRLGFEKDGFATLDDVIAMSVDDLPAEAKKAFFSLGAMAPRPARFDGPAAISVAKTDHGTLGMLEDRHLLMREDDYWLTLHQSISDYASAEGGLPDEAVARHRKHYLDLANEDREDWRRIEAAYDQIKYAWGNHPQGESVLDYVGALGVYQNLRGLGQDQLAWASVGLDVTRARRLQYEEATILNNIGAVHNALGDRQKALDFYGQALPIRREVGDRAGEAATLNNMGMVHDNLGDRQKALDFFGQALPIMQEVGDRASEATTLNNIGLVHYNLGDRQKALDFYGQALPITQEVGDRAGEAVTLNNIGGVHNALGDRQKALDFYGQALTIMREVGNRAGEATTLNNIGAVHDALGDRQKALDFFGQALPIRREVGDRAGEATTLNNMGMVHNALGDRQKALDFFGQALTIIREVGDRAGEATTRFNMATINMNAGDMDAAADQLRIVVELDRQVEHPDLERDSALLAQVEEDLRQQGEP